MKLLYSSDWIKIRLARHEFSCSAKEDEYYTDVMTITMKNEVSTYYQIAVYGVRNTLYLYKSSMITFTEDSDPLITSFQTYHLLFYRVDLYLIWSNFGILSIILYLKNNKKIINFDVSNNRNVTIPYRVIGEYSSSQFYFRDKYTKQAKYHSSVETRGQQDSVK